MAVVTLYTKPGCHLCETAEGDLLRVQETQPFELIAIDIRHDPALFAEYGERIPVVLVDGEFLCEYAVPEARLRERLKEVN